jgi:hypothetical protein
MKRYILFFVFSGCLLSETLQAQPEMDFENKTVKIPKTKEGELIKINYVFTNTGNQPLIISETKVACSCTKVKFPTHPVLPQKTDTIKVTFDTNRKIGYQDRIIEIYANTPKSPEKIRFKVMIDNSKHE